MFSVLNRPVQLALVFCFATQLSTQAFAFPMPKEKDFVNAADLFSAPEFDFEGIVALNNCSGSLIRLEKSKDSDAAYVMTNGHCLETGFPKPGQVISHQPSTRTFAIFASEAKPVGTLHAVEVIYSSMTKTDITLYKVKESYQEIYNQWKVRPFALLSSHPTISTPIQVVSGYWRRGYSCQVEAFVPHLLEGGYLCDDSIRYSRPGCEVIGGTSGSPIVQTGTRNVIGINNTINEQGQLCTEDNPCEQDINGDNSVAYKGYAYGQQTYLIYSCLDARNEVDLNVPGCMLKH